MSKAAKEKSATIRSMSMLKSNLTIHTNFINNLLTDIYNLNGKGQLLLVSKLAV
jgi:hypothetical protein